MASLKLPSVADLDSTYACDDKPYIFENPDDLPVETLINHILPLPQEHCSRSVRVPGTSQPGYSEIFRNGAFPNGLKSSIVPQLNTYHEIFKSGVERHSTATCLAFHEYDYENEQHLERYNTITYAEVNKRKTNLGDGLLFLLNNNNFLDASLASHQKIINHERDYQKYDKDDFSFIATFYSGNRVEWIISDLACSSNTITSTALYDTLGPGASVFILESTESPVVISSKSKIQQLINLKRDNPDKLKNLIMLVSMDPLAPKDGHLFKQAESSGIKIYDFKQVEGVGAVFPRKGTPPNPDSVFTITFTSGTTGANPKGVVLTQRSVATAISTATVLLPHSSKSKEFAFLPLAHIFERQMSAANFIYGGSVALPRLGGTPLTLFQDLKLWKPTILANVPRIFSKIEATLKQITKNADPTQFDGATRKKLRAAIGFDEIERCFTGGAPIAADTVRYLKDALGMGFTQGYGLSESFAGMLMAMPFHAPSVGTCGPISPGCEARVREIPEMGYLLSDKGGPRGELQLRGPQMFTHYYKNPEETAKAVDADGWFSTGDVAQVTNDGWFIIIDRVKNFFKLAQGEYVTPEKIENLYLTSNSLLTQAYAHGDFTNSYLVGVVGVDPNAIKSFLKQRMNFTDGDLADEEKILEICNRRETRVQILLHMNSNVGSKLNGFEKLHNIYVEFEPLRLDREVITPTSKLRRPIAYKYFKKQLDAMYKEGSIVKDIKL